MITLSHTGATVGIKIQLGRALLPVVIAHAAPSRSLSRYPRVSSLTTMMLYVYLLDIHT